MIPRNVRAFFAKKTADSSIQLVHAPEPMAEIAK
jgi:hypothetical protein